MRTGTGWSLWCTGSAAIFRGGADGRRQSAFVNLADRSPLFQQLRSRLKSRAPVSCTGSSWVIGIRASTPREADQGCRAISGPLTPVTSGLSRSLTDSPLRTSGHITGPDGTASQAANAGFDRVTDLGASTGRDLCQQSALPASAAGALSSTTRKYSNLSSQHRPHATFYRRATCGNDQY